MKKIFKTLLFAALVLSVGLSFAACVDSSAENNSSEESLENQSNELESPNEKMFYATVTELTTDFGGILVKPEGDALPSELIVHAAALPALSVGDRIKIQHDGQIALSYPGQIFGAVVTLVK